MLSRLRVNAGSWLIHTQSIKRFNTASYCSTSSQTRITTMLKIAGPISGTGHKCVTVNGQTGRGTLPLEATFFQPACGVIKWPPNGCLSFSSSRRAENKAKRIGRSVGRNKMSSETDTSRTGQTICNALKGNVNAKSKHALGNDCVDIREKNKKPDIGFCKDDRELVTAFDKQQTNGRYRSNPSDKQKANGSYRSNLHKVEKPKKNKLKTEKIDEKPLAINNDQQAQDTVMETNDWNKLQTTSSPRRKIARLKQMNLNIQKTYSKASSKLETKSSAKTKVDKAAQLEKKKLKLRKTDEKDLAINNDKQAQNTVMETNDSNKLQTISSPRKKIAQLKQMNLNIQKIDSKASAKLETKSSAKAKVDKAAQLEKKTLKLQKTDEKDLAKKSKASNVNVVVVVESETKAKTIQKYLGNKYSVVASYGHVRDLAPRSGSVRPNEDFLMIWEVPATAWTHIKRIQGALTGVKRLVLASDPDREGEAIAWHIAEVLEQQGALKKNVLIQRVVFHEVTESAIRNAMESPRDIDMSLVHARHARSALDYLIGFNISPLLWRKLPGCQSAGRVQSAALSLICDQENEIEKFVPQEYWSVEAKACTQELPLSGLYCAVLAKVTHRNGKKLAKFSINKKTEAENIAQKVSSSNFRVLDVERSTKKRKPPPPYITSTLQRDAANKLKFSATKTMSLAQKLYEGVEISDNEVSGLITYMRTDGLRISEEAAENIRSLVTECYGEDFSVKSTRKFSRKVKNAQEAHEAIRPTDIRRTPSMLATILEKDLLKLYTLIWCQAMACQMSEANISQISASFENTDKSVILRSSGSAISFRGYLAVLQDNTSFLTNGEETEQKEEDDNFSSLSELKEELIAEDEEQQKKQNDYFSFLLDLKIGDLIYMKDVQSLQHFTQPPPRYSEGSLIEKLEALGIGRPSTYASTIKTLQAREYITIRARRIFPAFRGRMVSKFLSHFFPEIVNYSFTAYMESQLDDVSTGSVKWKDVLNKFWESFHPVCERVSKVGNNEVQNMLTESFEDYLFGTDRKKSRTCPECKTGTLTLKATRHGAGFFVGCNRYPECSYIEETSLPEEDIPNSKEGTEREFEPKLLGTDVKSKMKVFLKSGPYGPYVQLGEDAKIKDWKPKRASVPKTKVENISLDDALELLRYPVILGNHPEDEKPVTLARMKYGFSVKHRYLIATVPKEVDPHAVSLDMAIQYLEGKDVRRIGYHGQKSRRIRTKVL